MFSNIDFVVVYVESSSRKGAIQECQAWNSCQYVGDGCSGVRAKANLKESYVSIQHNYFLSGRTYLTGERTSLKTGKILGPWGRFQ